MPRKPTRRRRHLQIHVPEQALLNQPSVPEALNQLIKRGVDRRELLGLLCAIPGASDKKEPLVNGIPDPGLRVLPDRLRHCADQIEHVNSSRWFDPKQLPDRANQVGNPDHLPKPLPLMFSPGWPEATARNFERLPGILRLYADYVSAYFESCTRLGWNTRLFRRGFRPRTVLILELLKAVEEAAGRPCYDQIAALLTGAYAAAGEDRTITADKLAKIKKNNPFLWASMVGVFSAASPEQNCPPASHSPRKDCD
jgi:hypothetical protein